MNNEIEEYHRFFESLWREYDGSMAHCRRKLREWADARNFTFYDMGLAEYYEEAEEDEFAPEEEPLDPNSREARYAHFEQHAGLLNDYISLEFGRKNREDALTSLACPGWRLSRIMKTDRPRNWEKRWRDAYDSLSAQEKLKACKEDMVALVSCEIWSRLSVFGLPYPPFDYDSGMDVIGVPFSECEKLGLMTEAAMPQMRAARESLFDDSL